MDGVGQRFGQEVNLDKEQGLKYYRKNVGVFVGEAEHVMAGRGFAWYSFAFRQVWS